MLHMACVTASLGMRSSATAGPRVVQPAHGPCAEAVEEVGRRPPQLLLRRRRQQEGGRREEAAA